MAGILSGVALGLWLAGVPRVVAYVRKRRCLTRCGEGHTLGPGCLLRNR